MSYDAGRIAQVFMWKQGSAADAEYALHVLGIVNPETARTLGSDDSRLKLYTISGPWPDEPWERAIADMLTVPSPDGSQWTDTSRYDLTGWQGTDSSTGERLFTVTAYRRATPPPSVSGSSVSAPRTTTPSVAQVPYYPEFPSGPLAWPPTHQENIPTGAGNRGEASTSNRPLVTNPLGRLDTTPPVSLPPSDAGTFSYGPYYAGFGTRLAAGLIDFFFMSVFQIGTIVGLMWRTTMLGSPQFVDWLREVWLFLGLGALVFVLYHAVQLTLWGQTIGKRLMSIKVVTAQGRMPGFGQVTLRMIGYLFSAAVAGWGFVMLALDPRRQGLHDRIAETYVVPEVAPAVPPPGLPGYGAGAGHTLISEMPAHTNGQHPAAALGMAVVSSPPTHAVMELAATAGDRTTHQQLTTDDVKPASYTRTSRGNTDTTQLTETASGYQQDAMPQLQRGPVTDMNMESSYHPTDFLSRSERARALFKQGLIEMERGTQNPPGGATVDPGAARAAAGIFKEGLLLVPNSVAYRYFHAVALRYSASYDRALEEFKRVLELDPNHYEARQQIAYDRRWHDAFAYPSWVSPAPVEVGMPVPPALLSLLPAGLEPVTRIVLLREGGNKMAAFLSRTPRAEWSGAGAPEVVNARLHLTLSRTPPGPIVALYVVLHDKTQDPYVGETFLNPRDLDHPAADACLLGQHMLEQLGRQDKTFLIFVDEENRLLMSRKLVFEAHAQVNIARILYDAQILPQQSLSTERFLEAAKWHMEHFPLNDIKSAGL